MSHPEHAENLELTRNSEAQEKFFAEELHHLSEMNAKLSREHADLENEITERRKNRRVFTACCMDERCAHTEEALGVLPGEGEVYGSGGARLTMETFKKFAADLEDGVKNGAEAIVYLTTHKSSAGAELGCAAFKNDVAAQVEYFNQLKEEIAKEYPDFKVHVLMHDTKEDHLETVNADERDATLAPMLVENKKLSAIDREHAHNGYGIYVGDAYRAWNKEVNKYFRLDAANPNLTGNLGIALAVMQHHSKVDLGNKPIVIHVDLPKYEDAERTAAAREAIERQLTEALRTPDAAELLESGMIKIVRTETDMKTWEGKQVGAPEFEK